MHTKVFLMTCLNHTDMVNVVVVRHAHSVGNKFGIRQGQIDFPLSSKGLEQCKKLPSILSEYNISKVYHSDLRRASETVEYSGLSDEISTEPTEKLREMDFGEFSGTVADFDDDEALPYALDEHPKLGTGWPGGERYVEFYNRIRAFCHQLVIDHSEEETVAVVMHQGSLMVLRDFANEVAPLEKQYNTVPNLGGYEFKMITDKFGIDGHLTITQKTPIHTE